MIPYNLTIPVFPAKAVIIIDGGYWDSIRRKINVQNVDLVKLSDVLCHPAYRLRSYYFDGKVDYRQSFHDGLRWLPRFEVVLGNVVEYDTKCPECGNTFLQQQQKRVDVQLAVKLVHIATTKQVDMIVLIAGDQDFIPAVEIVKNSGVLLKLVHGSKRDTSTALRQLADETHELTEDFLKKHLREHSEEKKDVPPVKVKTGAIALPVAQFSDKRIRNIEELLIKAIQATPKRDEGKIPASDLGNALTTINSNWKRDFKVKKLMDLLIVAGEEILKVKVEKGVHYIIPAADIAQESETRETTSKKGIQFLLETLKELIVETGEESIPLINIGSRMAEKKPGWKKELGIKKLKDLLKLAEDRISLEKINSNLVASLKKK